MSYKHLNTFERTRRFLFTSQMPIRLDKEEVMKMPMVFFESFSRRRQI